MATNKLQIVGARFVIRETTFHFTSGWPVEIANANPLRTAIVFNVPTASPANVSTNENAGKNNGLKVQPNGVNLEFRFQDHGAITQYAWFALENNSSYDITVVEVEYHEEW